MENKKMDGLVKAVQAGALFNPENDRSFISKTEDGRFILKGSQHCYDTNHHLIDRKNGIDYLIDTMDIIDHEYPEDEGLIEWDDLINLVDIDYIIAISWRALEG